MSLRIFGRNNFRRYRIFLKKLLESAMNSVSVLSRDRDRFFLTDGSQQIYHVTRSSEECNNFLGSQINFYVEEESEKKRKSC